MELNRKYNQKVKLFEFNFIFTNLFFKIFQKFSLYLMIKIAEMASAHS